jgi:hypothetical protein
MVITHWISTLLVSALILWSGYSYLFNKTMIEAGKQLGFPNYLLTQFAVLNIIAAIVLLIPSIPMRYKEWAHVWIGIFLITSIVAHIAHKDPISIALINVVFIVLLVVANVTMYKM